MLTQAPKGTKDILPGESYKWHYIEDVIRRTCSLFGYREIRTPVFEHTELFQRSVGGTTDIVQKEMYTFDMKGRSLTLKPEGTAGVVRSFIENGLFNEVLPAKMYYLNSPTFRYEQPQEGRLREHHQFGVEVFGAAEASMDAEVIRLAGFVFSALDISNLELHINSIGCRECRPVYNERLRAYFRPFVEGKKVCATCIERYDRNPLRLLDCKEERCKAIAKDAPTILDCLCDECSGHFQDLQECLKRLNIEYSIDPYIVRGLDYYTRTVFEYVSNAIGAQGTVCGGGRYDKLMEECGGPEMPGMGFGMGMERLLLQMEKTSKAIPEKPLYDVYLASMGDAAKARCFALCDELRSARIRAECDHMGRSLKAQFKYAGKTGCPFVAVIGDNELENNTANVKNMKESTEDKISLSELTTYIQRQLKEEK